MIVASKAAPFLRFTHVLLGLFDQPFHPVAELTLERKVHDLGDLLQLLKLLFGFVYMLIERVLKLRRFARVGNFGKRVNGLVACAVEVFELIFEYVF